MSASAATGTRESVSICNRQNDGSGVEAGRLDMPLVGLGVYQASPEETRAAVGTALQLGYRHIDTAALYRNENAVGAAIKKSGIPPSDVFVTTKLWNSDHGYERALKAFEKSRAALGVDVDLYLVHSPLPQADRLESWRALETLLDDGKVRSIGVSNYGVHHLQELLAHCRWRPSVNQIELHPLNSRKELVEFCQKEGIQLVAYSPLARAQKLKHPVVGKVAKHIGKSPAQVMLRWGIQKGFVVLPKSVTPSRIKENAEVFGWSLSDGDMAELDALDEGYASGWDPTTAP